MVRGMINKGYFWMILPCMFLCACHQDFPGPESDPQTLLSKKLEEIRKKDRYLIVLKDPVVFATKGTSFNKREQAALDGPLDLLEHFQIDTLKVEFLFDQFFSGFSAYLDQEEVELLKGSNLVERVERDGGVSLPESPSPLPQKPASMPQKNPQDVIPVNIARVGGPVKYTGKQVVYIMDTGIDLKHSELNVNEKLGFNAFYFGDDSKSLQDEHGHGTHVAGIIGAKLDGKGIAGVAAGATVVPVKVLNKAGNGSLTGFLAALEHISKTACAGDVVNISLTSPTSKALDDGVLKLANKGVFVTMAAGNDSKCASKYSPTRTNHKNVFTVSAMDENDVFASFSNYGSPPIDWCAPGVDILSTWLNNGFKFESGTSMAAPHVAAMLLLGGPVKGGMVKDDPDGDCDPIAVLCKE